MIVGTAGHIDHGKTSLVRALTGVDTDRLKEEKARGISIDLGFAYLPTLDGLTIGFVDVPGHERFVHNMLAGATGIDFVLLIVAADDGVMPQTLEHLAIVDLLGIDRGLVALTKVDLVPAERLKQVDAEIRIALSATALAAADVVPVSSASGRGIEHLREMLFAAARAQGGRGEGGRFRLAVDRSFTLAGIGTVVTGTVMSGALTVGDRVMVSPSGRAARVRSIHAQNRPVEQGHAGDRCALNLAGEGISRDEIVRGDVVLDPAVHAPTDHVDAALRLLASELKALTQWMPVRLHHAAAEVGARIVLLDDGPIAPGAAAFVQLILERPIAAAVGDRFVVRDTSARRTIGGGTLLNLRAPARKRRGPERKAALRAHAIADPGSSLRALLDEPPGYVDLTAFERDRALNAGEMEAIVASSGIARVSAADTVWGLAAEIFEKLQRSIFQELGAFHEKNPDLPGMGSEQLRLLVEPRLPRPASAAMLREMARSGELSLDGCWVRLAAHEVRLTPRDQAIWARIRSLLGGEQRFRPPRVRDVALALSASEGDIRRVLKLLRRKGEVDEVAHDHFFTREALGEVVEIVRSLSESEKNGEFSLGQLRDRLDNGRKLAMQILEFFDRQRITLRRGDLRRVDTRKLDLLFPRPEISAGLSISGGESSPVGRPDFKSGRGREPVFGGFDSHSLPPSACKD